MLIVDAVEPLSYQIKPEYIALARQNRGDKTKCVYAQAFRAIKDVVEAVVGCTVTLITFKSGKTLRYRTTAEMREALIAWDRGMKFPLRPGHYKIDVMSKSQTLKASRIYQARYKGIIKRKFIRNPRAASPRHVEFLRRKRAA